VNALVARATLLGERIDTAGLERRDAISTAPLALRVGEGVAVMFRYGVVVTACLEPAAAEAVLRAVEPHVEGLRREREEEVLELKAGDGEEAVGPDGALHVSSLEAPTLLIVADALAKSVALARDERHMAEVFDTVEPWGRRLAAGKRPGSRRAMIRLIGSALLVQHRLAQRVGAREKPDVLWDHPGLERLYARLESEYELAERAETLERKLDLVGETVTVMTDLIDAQRAFRLEAAVVLLILAEIGLTLVQMVRG
jgi:uncharacterized Rmd1/YagE family protein